MYITHHIGFWCTRYGIIPNTEFGTNYDILNHSESLEDRLKEERNGGLSERENK